MTHRTEICPRAPPGEKQLFASAAANTGPDPPAACGRGNIVRSTAASVAAANEHRSACMGLVLLFFSLFYPSFAREKGEFSKER